MTCQCRSSKSYEDRGETSLFSNEKGPTTAVEEKCITDNEVVVKIDDDTHIIDCPIPQTRKERKEFLKGDLPRLRIRSTLTEELGSETLEGPPTDPKPNPKARHYPAVYGENGRGEKPEGTNFSGARDCAVKDIAVQALQKDRVTTNKAFWKELKKARKAPQEINYRLPRDLKLNHEQKKDLLKIIDKIVKGKFQATSVK